MSFGGGWFFVVQTEAITVLNQQIKLPGLGSYMALATEKGDQKAALLATIAMVFVVVVSDQLVWRPIVAWSQRFRMEQVESSQVMTSWFLDFLKKSRLIRMLFEKARMAVLHSIDLVFAAVLKETKSKIFKIPKSKRILEILANLAFVLCLLSIGYYSIVIVREIKTGLNLEQVQKIVGYGLWWSWPRWCGLQLGSGSDFVLEWRQ